MQFAFALQEIVSTLSTSTRLTGMLSFTSLLRLALLHSTATPSQVEVMMLDIGTVNVLNTVS